MCKLPVAPWKHHLTKLGQVTVRYFAKLVSILIGQSIILPPGFWRITSGVRWLANQTPSIAAYLSDYRPIREICLARHSTRVRRSPVPLPTHYTASRRKWWDSECRIRRGCRGCGWNRRQLVTLLSVIYHPMIHCLGGKSRKTSRS